MAAGHSTIPPFPGAVDRRDFGNYVSGLVDGEGCFILRWNHGSGSAKFQLALRHDDRPILELVQSFWGCGYFEYSDRRAIVPNHMPRAAFCVCKTSDLARIVAPNFERFPLRAKKRRDFDIWNQGVRLIDSIKKRPRRRRYVLHGTLPKWTTQERSLFRALFLGLKAVRDYQSSAPEKVLDAEVDEQGCFW